jgi:phosphoenolpyruvate carboxylase
MTSYPEKVPQSAPIKNFYFSLDAASDSKAEIKNQISMLEERIEKIIQHFTVDDMPIIRFILNMTHDKEIIKGISKALDRVSDLVEHHDNLSSKLKVIEHAEQDPSWFAYTFGDFSSSIDNDLKDIFGDSNG